MEYDIKSIKIFKNLILTTNLQSGYQNQIALFRVIRTFLKANNSEYDFSGNIVENNMDYSYFQFTNSYYKDKGLKFVIAFVYKSFSFEIWLSGFNRKFQVKYFNALKGIFTPEELLTANPTRTDYIIRKPIEFDYNDVEKSMNTMNAEVGKFVDTMKKWTDKVEINPHN